MRLLSTFFALLFCLSLHAQETVYNRYSMTLLPNDKGGYSLKYAQKYEKIIDLAKVPDLLVPYKYKAAAVTSKDYKDIPTKEFVFKTYPGYELRLSVDPAPGDAPAPFMIYIHGGGWARGDMGANRDLSKYCAAKCGVTGVRISYTLAPQPGATVLVSIQDVLDAVQWVRDNAAMLNVDPDRFGFMGGSAGGHLAAMGAMKTPGTKVLVGLSGIYDLTTAAISAKATAAERIAYFCGKDPAVLREASPIFNIPAEGALPATLLIHGTGDIVVESGQSVMMRDALQKAGCKKLELTLVQYYDHGVASTASDKKEEMLLQMYNFIKDNI